jgi:hypothetical protein
MLPLYNEWAFAVYSEGGGEATVGRIKAKRKNKHIFLNTVRIKRTSINLIYWFKIQT